MKTIILIVILSVAAFVLAACPSTPMNMNANTPMNNANAPMNMNGNSMPSNMPMKDDSNMPGMSDMKSSPNAASAPYDLQFIDTMTMHHQGAIDMAKMALEKSQNADLKKFAQKIIDDQNKEIAQMKEWRGKWFKDKPEAMNMEMSGMKDSMKMMMGEDMKKMQAASGKECDLMFLDMMTPHHQGAITMAKEALTKTEKPEIKTLSNNIIKAQEAEIKQMADWKAKWSK